MATGKQRRAVKKIMENRGMGVSTIMALPEVGYKIQTAKNPKNLTDSKGYKESLAEFGLTEELIRTSLVHDIKKKPLRRVRELELGSDILRMRGKTEEGGNKVLIINIIGETAKKYGISNIPKQSPEPDSI